MPFIVINHCSRCQHTGSNGGAASGEPPPVGIKQEKGTRKADITDFPKLSEVGRGAATMRTSRSSRWPTPSGATCRRSCAAAARPFSSAAASTPGSGVSSLPIRSSSSARSMHAAYPPASPAGRPPGKVARHTFAVNPGTAHTEYTPFSSGWVGGSMSQVHASGAGGRQ